MAAKIENIGSIINMSQIGIDSRSTEDLIQLALAAPEDDDYLKEHWHFVSLLQHRGNREVLDRPICGMIGNQNS